MKIASLDSSEVLIIEPDIFSDGRGFFFESFNQRVFQQAIGDNIIFVQDNHSRSQRGVLRGLHYQLPNAQGKLVRVISGEVFDVAVDIRQTSETYKKWVGATLSEQNKKQLWIPEGFAHGFLVLSQFAEVLYKTTSYYSKPDERTISWNDPEISIKWPIVSPPILSLKDQEAPPLSAAKHFD